MNRASVLLGINRKTTTRKLLFLAHQARLEHRDFLERLKSSGPLRDILFDEMESFEISKCLPVSIPLAVQSGSRKILGFRVCRMPAKGPLAEISRRKYGPRVDERAPAARSIFAELAPLLSPRAEIRTDQNPNYPTWLRSELPGVTHLAFKGRRGCVVGQGELKKIGFDPLFDLNHTCAMLRANVNRLFRRTWCTSKRRDRLEAHIWLYVQYHNRVLTRLAEAA